MIGNLACPGSDLWRCIRLFIPVILLVSCGGGNGEESQSVTQSTPAEAAPETPNILISAANLPKGFIGFDTQRIAPATLALHPISDFGAFRILCDFSHMAPDDPIVFPGQPGRSHLHAFFGNTGANAHSTSQSLLESGRSTCHGGIANRSAYWVAAILDTRTGQAVRPNAALFYYKPGYDGVKAKEIQAFPEGLRMIAGDPTNSVPPSERIRFTCLQNSQLVGASFVNCPAGDELVIKIEFPQCWDGVNLDSPDHQSHMSYAQNACPKSHPIPLPLITFNIHIPVKEHNEVLHWRLSSDNYQGPAGYSMHADWWNGWQPEVMNIWLQHCIREGWDCRANLLGDGRTLY